MTYQTFRTILFQLLLAVAVLGANAKTCRVLVVPGHVLSPSSDTEVLSKSDSLVIYACPAFSNGIISYDTEAELKAKLREIEVYLADKSLEGEYYLWPKDADTKKDVGYTIATSQIHLEDASGDSEAERMVKGDLGFLLRDFLFIVFAIAFAVAAFYLFSSRKLGLLGKVLGCVAAVIAIYLGFIGVAAIALLAFKYIFILICGLLAVLFIVFFFMKIGSSKGKKGPQQQTMYRADNGLMYMTRMEAQQNSKNPDSVTLVKLE